MYETLLKKLVAAQMMRAVTARYVFLQKIGCSFEHVSRYNLDESPEALAVLLLGPHGLRYWEGEEKGKVFIENLISESLPEGIVVVI